LLLADSPRESENVLFEFSRKLVARPSEFGAADIQVLKDHRFTEETILETIVTIAFANFLNILQTGLGVEGYFGPREIFRPTEPQIAHLLPADCRHTEEGLPEDPDAECVNRVRRGDLAGFEELINRHSRRVYRTLIGVLSARLGKAS